MRSLDIHCLDVGQGDATIILPPEGEGGAIIFDCCDATVVRQTLDLWGVSTIDALVLSHMHDDHIAGAVELIATELAARGLKRVFLYPHNLRRHYTQQTLRGVLGAGLEIFEAIRLHAPLSPISARQDWQIDLIAPGFDVAVEAELDVAQGRRTTSSFEGNTPSAVLRVRMGRNVVLIGADAPLHTWAWLHEHHPTELPARVFRIPHHGGALTPQARGWTPARLYREVGCEVAVVSVGTTKNYGHPAPAWIGPDLLPAGCRMMCTQVTKRCQPGVESNPRRMRESALDSLVGAREHFFFFEPLWRHYTDTANHTGSRSDEVPCAGTILISLRDDGTIEVLPTAEDHAEMIDQWSQPACRGSRGGV